VLNRTQEEFINESQLGITDPRKSHASLMNSEFHHFCPDCFMLPNPLEADIRNATATRKDLEYARDMRVRDDEFEDEIRDIWRRVEDFETDGTLALLELVGLEFQVLTYVGQYLVRRYYGLLIVDFWWRIMRPSVLQPTKKQRMVLLQLRTFMEHSLMHEHKKHYLAEQQGELFKSQEIATQIDILTLKDDELKCLICHERFGDNVDGVIEHPVKTTLCKHTFGHKCLELWLKDNETCPLDRRVIKPIDITSERQTIFAIIQQDGEAHDRGTPPWLSTLHGSDLHYEEGYWRIVLPFLLRPLPLQVGEYPEHGLKAIYEPRESHALGLVRYIMHDLATLRRTREDFQARVRETFNRSLDRLDFYAAVDQLEMSLLPPANADGS
jgi:hypothetical protein